MLANFNRALRLPFTSASILPYIFGSLIFKEGFNFITFCLGLLVVVGMHLSSNLMNDYADSKSSADWQDKKFYGFFGGSKLIQEGELSERWYFGWSIFFAGCSVAAVIVLCLILKSQIAFYAFLFILALAWSYSNKPLQFSYRRMGEFMIFVLFGPALVMGAYYIQSSIFPDPKSFMLSLPFGFFTTGILFANEIPDYPEDKKCAKFTWVSILGPKRSYLLYVMIMGAGVLSIIANVFLSYLSNISLFSLLLLPLMFKAAAILKKYTDNKEKLIQSSKLTILIQALASIILIVDAII